MAYKNVYDFKIWHFSQNQYLYLSEMVWFVGELN